MKMRDAMIEGRIAKCNAWGKDMEDAEESEELDMLSMDGGNIGGGGQGFERRRGCGLGREALGAQVAKKMQIKRGIIEAVDEGGGSQPLAEPAHHEAGKAEEDDEAGYGEGKRPPGELCNGESLSPSRVCQGNSALLIAELLSAGKAGIPGKLLDTAEDDDAESKRVVDRKNLSISIEEEFSHHKPGLARLNNGSFGSCPQSVLAAQENCSRCWLRQPDKSYFGPLEEGLYRARKEVADLVNAPVEEVFLLENVTAAASMVALDVMWAFAEGRYKKGDSILMLNFTYGALKKSFQAYAARAGGRIFQVQIPFPVSSEEQILQVFEEALEEEREENPSSIIRMAVFDHIVSMPTMILPIRQLIKLCRSYGVENIFIDGAHGIGNLELNLTELDADYYTSNLHKWMFAPTTAAFVHCKAKHLGRLHHPIVSHLYGVGIAAECSWLGTRDYSPLLAVPAAIKFVIDVAGSIENYSKFNHCKVVAMAEMLASSWGTFLGTPPEMCAAMAMVALPPALNIHSQVDLLALRRRIREEYQVDVHLYYAGSLAPANIDDASQGRTRTTAYVRISHQIYNNSDEYIKLRDVVNDIARKS
nr:L-cysteine desulfhydrase-like [Physcomitrium patens]|eukprot:XP_024378854.1 L-cysteine desulfhydrase-like [Physcomitrella patens]